MKPGKNILKGDLSIIGYRDVRLMLNVALRPHVPRLIGNCSFINISREIIVSYSITNKNSLICDAVEAVGRGSEAW